MENKEEKKIKKNNLFLSVIKLFFCYFLIPILVIGNIACLYYVYDVNIKENIEFKHQLVSLKSTLENNTNEIKEIKNKKNNESDILYLSNSIKELQANNKDYSNELSVLKGMSSNIKEHSSKLEKIESEISNNYWKKQEIKYLLSLINILSHTENDPHKLIVLLESALKVSREIQDENILSFQAVIEETILNLRRIETTDKNEVLLKLMAIENLLLKLELPSYKKSVHEVNKDEIGINEEKDWINTLKVSFNNFINEIIVVKKNNVADDILFLDDRYKSIIRNNLIIKVNLAQQAYLNFDNELYIKYLNYLERVISKYYNQEDNGVKVILEKIKYLKSTKFVNNKINDDDLNRIKESLLQFEKYCSLNK